MSVADANRRKRSVVPRWRSFLNTPSVELITSDRFPDIAPLTSAHFNDVLKIWLRDRGPADFADIMDAGIATGSRFLALRGARELLALGKRIRDRVRQRAEAIVYGGSQFLPQSDLPFQESVREEIICKIGRLKRLLNESPRNALSHVEVARLYCRLAQFGYGEKHILIALRLAPDDRFVLRSATRFFTMLDENSTALRFLRSSNSVRYDPWVQSAELAAAVLEGKQARFADKAAKRIMNLRSIRREQSELASGWVSRLRAEGMSSRQTLKLLARTLQSPTENALAQGVWLVDSTDGDFHARFPDIRPSVDAHEAKSILLTDSGDFPRARSEAASWFVDQPFQARSSIHLAFLNFVHLGDYAAACRTAEDGLAIHNEDWMLLNLAVLSNIYVGNMERAREHLVKFSRVVADDEQRAFLFAAQGMLAVETGQFDEGIKHYLKSIRISKLARKPELVVNAAIYLIECAARKGFVSPGDFDEFKAHVEKGIRSLPPAARKDITAIWRSRRSTIVGSLDQFDFTVSEALPPAMIEESMRNP